MSTYLWTGVYILEIIKLHVYIHLNIYTTSSTHSYHYTTHTNYFNYNDRSIYSSNCNIYNINNESFIATKKVSIFCRVNYLDLAPKQASVILGIGNTIATLPGIVSPIITGYITQNKVSLYNIVDSIIY